MKTVVITGANGLLGTALCRRFSRAGWRVRAGIRRDRWLLPEFENVEPFLCDLPERLDAAAFEGADACIHAAYMTRFQDRACARRVNIAGTLKVHRLARRHGVGHFTFISSCSAHENAEGLYGRSKFYLEGRMDLSRDLVVRPGLILGHGGLFARMVHMVRSSRIIPLFDGGKQTLQAIHVDDLAEAIFRAVERRLAGRLVLAHPEPVLMRVFQKELARRLGYRPRFIRVPSQVVVRLLQFLESRAIRLPVSSDNLLGLRSMKFQDSRPSLHRLDLRVRSAWEALDDLFSQDVVPGKSLTAKGKSAS